MTAQRAPTAVKLVRLAAAAGLAGLAVVVGLRLAARRDKPVLPAAERPGGRSVDVKERVRHQEFLEGKLRAAVRGDVFFLGADGRNHLTGSVEIRNFEPSGEVVSRVSADEVVYDPGGTAFAFKGRVRVETRRAVLESGALDYDQERGLFTTSTAGVFSSGGLAGRAAAVSYSAETDEVRLSGGFRVDLAGSGSAAERGALTGDALTYLRAERRGRVEGRVEFSGARCRLRASSMEFLSTAEEGFFETLALGPAAEVDLTGAEPGRGDRGEIRADRIEVAFKRESARPRTVKAQGDCRVTLVSASGGETTLESAAAAFELEDDGRVGLWSASGGLRLTLRTPDGAAGSVEAASAAWDSSARTIRAAGGPGRPATADAGRARVRAAVVSLGTDAGDMAASGNAEGLLKPRAEGSAEGFFADAGPVFVAGSSLAYQAGPGALSLRGEARLWQERASISAGEITLMERTGNIRGRMRVLLIFSEGSGASPGRRAIELGGEEMDYSASGRRLSFKRAAFVRLPEARLEAEDIAAILDEERAGLERMTAASGVRVVRGRLEGRGETALFDARANRLVLAGRPVLTDAEGRVSRGDKLTFDLSDDKILLENEGRGRSTTVIKS